MSFTTLPRIGMGTFRLRGDDARDAVKSALSLGYRHIDTAQMYNNEAEVGDGITSSGIPRREIFLTTKIWHDRLRADDLIHSLHDSLARLKTDHVNLALIHWPSPGDEVPMEEYLGPSGTPSGKGSPNTSAYPTSPAPRWSGQRRSSVTRRSSRTRWKSTRSWANRQVVAHAQRLGMTVTGYMPLAVGKVMDDPTLQRIALEHNATPAQIAIAWSVARGVVPIPSSTRPSHQKANLEALNLTLSEEDIRAIDALDRGERLANPGFAPDWD